MEVALLIQGSEDKQGDSYLTVYLIKTVDKWD